MDGVVGHDSSPKRHECPRVPPPGVAEPSDTSRARLNATKKLEEASQSTLECLSFTSERGCGQRNAERSTRSMIERWGQMPCQCQCQCNVLPRNGSSRPQSDA